MKNQFNSFFEDVIFISKLIPSEIKPPLTSLLSFLKKVKHTHFANGDLKLKCTATISTVYWKSNEESVQGSGFNAHTAPVSESRGRTSGENQLNIPGWGGRGPLSNEGPENEL